MKNIYIGTLGGFLSGSETAEPSWIYDTLRTFFSFLDNAAYGLLGIMYELFFNVASAELFTNATIKNFYSRVQLIIGVFMVFKLAITIMQGIVNPDKFTDKNSGFGSIITRVVFALVMLTLLVPINIPGAKTEYEIQLNNNGLLFGTLYSLQNRLLSNNTLGRLILGTTDESITTTNSDDNTLSGADKQAESIKKSANVFTSTVFKGFFRINLLPGKSDETKNDNRMCSDIDDDILDVYKQLDASPSELLAFVNEECSSSGNKRYVFCYLYIISTIVAVIFAFILGGFIIDIAVRAVKLAVLRLIAPIPIISYIEPKQAKEGAFAAWVKALTSTYLDLFLRLAIVYFVIFLIQDMIVNGIVINTGTGIIGAISVIFIWIGLFFFARQAPKFIKDVLGLKGPGMSNIGLSAMLGGTAMLAGGGGLRGAALGAIQGAEGSVQAQNQGKAMPLGQVWSQNRDNMAKIRTGDKDAHGGIIGGAIDNLNYRVRDSAASRLGLSEANVDRAKSDMIKAQNKLRAAKDSLEQYDKAVSSEQIQFNQLTRKAKQDEINRLQDEYENAQRTYQKGDDARTKQFGVSDRPIDRWGISDRTTMAERGHYNRAANSRHGGYIARQRENARRTLENVQTARHNAYETVASLNGLRRDADYHDYNHTDTFRNSRAYPVNGNDPGHLDDDFTPPGGGPPPGP